MKIRKYRALWMAFLLLLPLPVRAGDPAAVPYTRLVQVRHRVQTYRQYDALKPRMTVKSTQKGKGPGEITLTVTSKHGPVVIRIGKDGGLHLPVRQDWIEENPLVVSNQPAGTLVIELTMALRLPDADEFTYRDLVRPVAQFNRAVKNDLAANSGRALEAAGLELRFLKTENAAVFILAAAGTRQLRPDKEGILRLLLEKALIRENPIVRVSQRPLQVLPLIR